MLSCTLAFPIFEKLSSANKYWSGLLKDYYGPRAAIYFKYLIQSLQKGESFNLEGWRREWIKLTNDWQKSRKVFPVKGNGDALNTSLRLFDKYFRNQDGTGSIKEPQVILSLV